jgi:hypothetical protein
LLPPRGRAYADSRNELINSIRWFTQTQVQVLGLNHHVSSTATAVGAVNLRVASICEKTGKYKFTHHALNSRSLITTMVRVKNGRSHRCKRIRQSLRNHPCMQILKILCSIQGMESYSKIMWLMWLALPGASQIEKAKQSPNI